MGLSDAGGCGALECTNDTKVLGVNVHSRKGSTAVMLAIALKALIIYENVVENAQRQKRVYTQNDKCSAPNSSVVSPLPRLRERVEARWSPTAAPVLR